MLRQIVGVASLLTNSLKSSSGEYAPVELRWCPGGHAGTNFFGTWHMSGSICIFQGLFEASDPGCGPGGDLDLSDPNRPLAALRVWPALVRFLPLARRRDCVLACMFSMTPPLWGCPLPRLWVNNLRCWQVKKWLFCLLFLYNNFEIWFQSLWANSTTLLLSCGICGSSAINFLGILPHLVGDCYQ